MRSKSWVVLGICALALLATGFVSAQSTSTATETKSFEIIAVDGNNVVVRLPEGTRELTVPDDFRFTVDGRQLSVRELQAGMNGTATITTTTTVTPVTVTEIKNGTVAQVTGSTLIVRTDEGHRSFTQSDIDKRGIKILRSGQPAQLSEFRTGDRLTATIVTSKPPTVVTEKEVQATLAAARQSAPSVTAPPTPSSAPAAAATTASAATTGAPRTLPKTASRMPLIGVVGVTALMIGAALAIRRRRLAR